MIYSLKLSRFRCANVWLDEELPAAFGATSELTRNLNPKIRAVVSRKLAAVEISTPRGAMASYALLGAELVDVEGEGVKIIVPISSMGPQVTSSLALKSDEVRLGLPDEYAGAVFTGVRKFAESHGLPGKVAIRFSWAAHGSVASSPSAFENASGLVVKLLALPNNPSEAQIVALFE